MPSSIYTTNSQDPSITLHSPVSLPNACGFLWNPKMMIQMNCRGYAQAQHMQPEPAKYAKAPGLEAQTFMQPEHHYYAHHPGRFVYVKEAGKNLLSLPYEPVRNKPESFKFIHLADSLKWEIVEADIRYVLTLRLSDEDALEMWNLSIENMDDTERSLSIYPYFPFGYLSWMNQGAAYDEALQAIIGSCVTPYQKAAELEKIKALKDLTFFASDRKPDSWTCVQNDFEGQGGLHNPQGVAGSVLSGNSAVYEVPTACMQFNLKLAPTETQQFNWLFGPAQNRSEIEELLKHFKAPASTHQSVHEKAIRITCPDSEFSDFVNSWLPRQIQYHGESNRLTTDPQTRNFLQDHMAMLYLEPSAAKQSFLLALKQQKADGEMPDGILLHKDAELKYINKIPHSDHNVWLVIFLSAYLNETNDLALLDTRCAYSDDGEASVFDHIEAAMRHLNQNLDARGLAKIHQGDWCDPMNMVGYKGKGVSSWLTMATAYSFKLWSAICKRFERNKEAEIWLTRHRQLNSNINQHFKEDNWYARGITDEGKLFGVNKDSEGKIFLNPQSWSLLCDAASNEETEALVEQVNQHLWTPYGPMLLAPSYTQLREDIGRVTQKSAGVAENGSVYNHAAAFYAAALYSKQQESEGYKVLRAMLPNEQDVQTRGQLPVYIPNYYRGAFYQHPKHAGRSSHLFNTGTLAWYYQTVIEGLFGLKGDTIGLRVEPQLPSDWHSASATRHFRGVTYHIDFRRADDLDTIKVSADSASIEQNLWVVNPQTSVVNVTVLIPMAQG